MIELPDAMRAYLRRCEDFASSAPPRHWHEPCPECNAVTLAWKPDPSRLGARLGLCGRCAAPRALDYRGGVVLIV